MPNACFRCKQSIGSGETFCSNCRREVGVIGSTNRPDDPVVESEHEGYADAVGYTKESRLWVGVAATTTIIALLIVGPLGFALATGASLVTTGLLGVGYSWLVAVAFGYLLVKEYQHVSRRDDTDWNPSKWLYISLAAVSILIPVLPVLVGPYHLYKRKEAIGLVLRTADS